MKIGFIFLAFFLSFNAGASSPILGTWNLGRERFRAAKLYFNHEIKIEENQLTKFTYCTINRNRIKAQVTVPIEIVGNQIKVLSSAKEEIREVTTGALCAALIDAQEITFSLSADLKTATFKPYLGEIIAIRVTHTR